MSFFLINDIRLNLPMGWVPFQLLYLGPFSNVRCIYGSTMIDSSTLYSEFNDLNVFLVTQSFTKNTLSNENK